MRSTQNFTFQFSDKQHCCYCYALIVKSCVLGSTELLSENLEGDIELMKNFVLKCYLHMIQQTGNLCIISNCTMLAISTLRVSISLLSRFQISFVLFIVLVWLSFVFIQHSHSSALRSVINYNNSIWHSYSVSLKRSKLLLVRDKIKIKNSPGIHALSFIHYNIAGIWRARQYPASVLLQNHRNLLHLIPLKFFTVQYHMCHTMLH